MADPYTAADLIEARLAAAWTATAPERLRFDNGPLINMKVLAPFCQIEIAIDDDEAYIGGQADRMSRADGVVMLHMMAPQGSGMAAIKAMYRNARSALANQNFGGVYMQGAIPNRGRPSSDDGSYRGVTAVVPFFFIYPEG